MSSPLVTPGERKRGKGVQKEIFELNILNLLALSFSSLFSFGTRVSVTSRPQRDRRDKSFNI